MHTKYLSIFTVYTYKTITCNYNKMEFFPLYQELVGKYSNKPYND